MHLVVACRNFFFKKKSDRERKESQTGYLQNTDCTVEWKTHGFRKRWSQLKRPFFPNTVDYSFDRPTNLPLPKKHESDRKK